MKTIKNFVESLYISQESIRKGAVIQNLPTNNQESTLNLVKLDINYHYLCNIINLHKLTI